jgi:hypothetical protein
MSHLLARCSLTAVCAALLAGCVAERPYYGSRPGGGRPDWDRPGWEGSPEGGSRTLVCESVGGSRNACRVGFRIREARLEKRFSEARCERGKGWGWRGDEVWVDRGCRARFRVWPGGGGRDGGRPGGAGPRRVRCESAGDRERCPVGFQIGEASLVRRLSKAACERGKSWGWRDDRIWVDRGCRAEIDVYPR